MRYVWNSTLVMSYPLFDEDDPNKVVATFGIMIPRQVQAELREISENIERGLGIYPPELRSWRPQPRK